MKKLFYYKAVITAATEEDMVFGLKRDEPLPEDLHDNFLWTLQYNHEEWFVDEVRYFIKVVEISQMEYESIEDKLVHDDCIADWEWIPF